MITLDKVWKVCHVSREDIALMYEDDTMELSNQITDEEMEKIAHEMGERITTHNFWEAAEDALKIHLNKELLKKMVGK